MLTNLEYKSLDWSCRVIYISTIEVARRLHHSVIVRERSEIHQDSELADSKFKLLYTV
jgi:hypothetical protein